MNAIMTTYKQSMRSKDLKQIKLKKRSLLIKGILVKQKPLAGDIEIEAETNSEESVFIEDYEGECERCALEYQPKACSMC